MAWNILPAFGIAGTASVKILCQLLFADPELFSNFGRFQLTALDLERDPRWGRNEEGYGEDPVLTGKMAGAYIRGMQGDDPKYLR